MNAPTNSIAWVDDPGRPDFEANGVELAISQPLAAKIIDSLTVFLTSRGSLPDGTDWDTPRRSLGAGSASPARAITLRAIPLSIRSQCIPSTVHIFTPARGAQQ